MSAIVNLYRWTLYVLRNDAYAGYTDCLPKMMGLKPRPSGRLFFLQPIYPIFHQLSHRLFPLLSNPPKLF